MLSNKNVLHLHTCTLLQVRSIRRQVMFYVRIARPNNFANLSYCQYFFRILSTFWTVSKIFSEFPFFLSG